MSDSDLQRQLDQASREVEQLRVENESLRKLLGLSKRLPEVIRAAEVIRPSDERTPDAPVSSSSSSAEKVTLIRRLFRG